MPRLLLLTVLLAPIGAYGCARSAPPADQTADEAVRQSPTPAEVVESKDVEKMPPAVDAETQRLLREAEAASRLAQSLSGATPAKPKPNAFERTATAPPLSAAQSVSRERFVVFTPQGPLICEVALLIDGQWPTDALDQLVEDALATAKTEQGGGGLWSKLLVSPRFRYGQFGNVATKNEEERQQAVMRYDLNRDDAIGRDEMRRFVTRNQAGGGSLLLHSDDPYRSQAGLTSPIWQLLDVDGDQVLSAQEMAEADARLRSRDLRDDESISPDELSAVERSTPMEDERRSTSYLSIAHALTADSNWNRLLATVEELYPRDQGETTYEGSWVNRFLKQLDADSDESLSTDELMAWSHREPDVRIDARFGADPSLALPSFIGLEINGPPPAKISAEVLPGATAPIAITKSGDTLELVLPRLTIEMARSDTAVGPSAGDNVAAAQFKQFDRDGNGYLERNEFNATGQAAGAFDGVDGDDANPESKKPESAKSEEVRDGKIFLNAWKIFLQRQQAASSSLIHVYVGSASDSLFFALNTDHDGRLGAREIAAVKTRLAALDTSGDGQLTASEVPQRMTIRLVRDNQPPERTASPRMTPPVREVVRAGPAWFQRMDANGDGDISPREFLGTAGLFRQLDGNRDGFIDAPEASKAAK